MNVRIEGEIADNIFVVEIGGVKSIEAAIDRFYQLRPVFPLIIRVDDKETHIEGWKLRK